MENAFGCQSAVLKRRCHQGPLLGPHPHMKNAFLMVGPQCETWMKLCQAHCQENKRKVPESPLLTARRRGLTVHATPWSQQWGRHFGSPSFFRQYCGPVFGAIRIILLNIYICICIYIKSVCICFTEGS